MPRHLLLEGMMPLLQPPIMARALPPQLHWVMMPLHIRDLATHSSPSTSLMNELTLMMPL